MKVTTNDAGQKTITGTIHLKEDTEMLNRANDGLEPWDRRWHKPSSVIVPKGTLVDYRGQETRMGKYHTVTFRERHNIMPPGAGGCNIFYATKKTDEVNYGN